MEKKNEAKPALFRIISQVGEHFRLYWKDTLVLLLGGGAIIAIDQWTKVLVRANIPLGGDWLPEWLAWLMPYARIRHWYNSGAAFGMFQNGNLVFGILAVIVSLVIAYYYPRVSRRDWWLRLALTMQFAGALGNLVDRIQAGHVTDFLSLGNFAVFNVADSSISVGVAILVLGTFLKERAERKAAARIQLPPASDGGQEHG